MELIRPDSAYKDSVRAANEEFRREAEEAGRPWQPKNEHLSDFGAFLRSLRDKEEGRGLPEEFAAEHLFWLVDNGEYIGRLVIRHRLSGPLRAGWHLGYSVRPSKRRQGYGTKLLELGLAKAKELGIKSVFLVCDADNAPSKKIIERAGGKLEEEIPAEKTREPQRLEFSLGTDR